MGPFELRALGECLPIDGPLGAHDLRAERGASLLGFESWATWCSPLRAALPVLHGIAEHSAARPDAVLGLHGVTNLPTIVVVGSDEQVLSPRDGFSSDQERESGAGVHGHLPHLTR